jgi:curli biogenesis system outer membrane secretion channel CsgG
MRSKIGLGFLALVLTLGFSTGALSAEKKKIVVGDPKTKWASSSACRGFAPSYADTIARSLRSRIVQTGAFRVVSREQLKKVLREHEMAMTGLSDPSTAKILGQFLQADLIMATEVLCQPNSVEFVVNLVDVETAEIVWSKDYEMKNLKKVSRALKDIAKLLKKYAKTGAIGETAGKSESMMMIDSKALHDASEAIISILERSIPRARVTVEDVNVYAEKVKVRLSGNAWPGTRFKVMRDDEEIGWLYLKKKGHGSVEAGTKNEMSSFEQGDVGSTEDFRPKVAVGFIEDEDEGNDKMVEMFKEGLLKEMSEADRIEPVDDGKVDKIINRMGSKVKKKSLAKLFDKGVDLLITGRFSGENGNRRIDFEALSTFDGKRVTKIKYDSRL